MKFQGDVSNRLSEGCNGRKIEGPRRLYEERGEQMTNEEKHAIIAEKIEGIVIAEKTFTYGSRKGYQMQYPDGSPVWYPGGGFYGFGWQLEPMPYPNYSSSLDLVARAEAKVCKNTTAMHAYQKALQGVLGMEIWVTEEAIDISVVDAMIRASAATRVNALVSLAQMGVFDEK
jgi:hypothetical protein